MVRLFVLVVLLALVCACGTSTPQRVQTASGPATLIDQNSPQGKTLIASIRTQILKGCTYALEPTGVLRDCQEIPFAAEVEGSEVVLTYVVTNRCLYNLSFDRGYQATIVVTDTLPPPQSGVKIIPQVCPGSRFTFQGVDLRIPSSKV